MTPHLDVLVVTGGHRDDIELVTAALRAARVREPRVRPMFATDDLDRACARAHVLLAAGAGPTRAVVERARRHRVPVVVTPEAATPTVADGRSGVVCPREAEALGATIAAIARSPRLRARLARGVAA